MTQFNVVERQEMTFEQLSRVSVSSVGMLSKDWTAVTEPCNQRNVKEIVI